MHARFCLTKHLDPDFDSPDSSNAMFPWHSRRRDATFCTVDEFDALEKPCTPSSPSPHSLIHISIYV